MHFEFEHLIATVLISGSSIEMTDINTVAMNVQIKCDQTLNKFEFNAINAPNLLSVCSEFEHFIAIVPISVISMKNYQISQQLNFKLNVINLKFEFNAINVPNLLSV